MDLEKSSSNTASMKKLQDDGALPGRGTMQREARAALDGIHQGIWMRRIPTSGWPEVALHPLQCPTSRSKWQTRWFYLQIENLDPVLVIPEDQPEKIPEWTAKPALTPSLQSFIDIIDDLRKRGLSGYEVAADFVGRRIQPLQARAHPAFDYSGPDDVTRVSPRGIYPRISKFVSSASVSSNLSSSRSRFTGLDSDTVGRRIGQIMISCHAQKFPNRIPSRMCNKIPVQDQPGYTNDNVDIQIHVLQTS
uniref:Retrotransposon protein, putative, Ty3-gypsy subclass n=2 Tax=Oryza sativa subsp. japonica TaxID=39947 RepID=Q8LLZ3_ORYSJ|nr:Putative retroelement [Oryza sativa Japonica Group]AAP52159.1 retrotransposon protein, putative, Ty3-gypsy subclass [Oryza sativa Japonica Group]